MLSEPDYIRQSLELNLFFARIMKENLMFINNSLTVKNAGLGYKAALLVGEYDKLLLQTLSEAEGVIGLDAVTSDEIVTPFTLNAELLTRFYTGLDINTYITQKEDMIVRDIKLTGFGKNIEKKVWVINQNALILTSILIMFESKVLKQVVKFRMFTHIYPSLIAKMVEESKYYLKTIQDMEKAKGDRSIFEKILFWNEIMLKNIRYIKGLIDPIENNYIIDCERIENKYKKFAGTVKNFNNGNISLRLLYKENIELVNEVADLKTRITKGLNEVKIRSAILPLFADHALREAKHFIRLLKTS